MVRPLDLEIAPYMNVMEASRVSIQLGSNYNAGLGFNGVVIDLQHHFMICLNFQNLHKFRTEIHDIVVDSEQLRAGESRSRREGRKARDPIASNEIDRIGPPRVDRATVCRPLSLTRLLCDGESHCRLTATADALPPPPFLCAMTGSERLLY